MYQQEIANYFASATILEMCRVYGPRLDSLTMKQRTGLMKVLSIGIDMVAQTGCSEPLHSIALFEKIDVPDDDMILYLSRLDGELTNLQDAVLLLSGIAASTPTKLFEGPTKSDNVKV